MTDKKTEALKLALEALTHGCPPDCKDGMTDSGGAHPWGEPALIPCPNCEAIAAIREALAQQHEPVAWMWEKSNYPESRTVEIGLLFKKTDSYGDVDWTPLYTSPPPLKPLTDEEIAVIAAACGGLASDFVVDVARAIEQAHGITGETK